MEHILNLILRLRRLFSGRNDLFGGLSLKFHCSDGWGMKLSATNPLVIENKLNGWWNVHQETFFTIAVFERDAVVNIIRFGSSRGEGKVEDDDGLNGIKRHNRSIFRQRT